MKKSTDYKTMGLNDLLQLQDDLATQKAELEHLRGEVAAAVDAARRRVAVAEIVRKMSAGDPALLQEIVVEAQTVQGLAMVSGEGG